MIPSLSVSPQLVRLSAWKKGCSRYRRLEAIPNPIGRSVNIAAGAARGSAAAAGARDVDADGVETARQHEGADGEQPAGEADLGQPLADNSGSQQRDRHRERTRGGESPGNDDRVGPRASVVRPPKRRAEERDRKATEAGGDPAPAGSRGGCRERLDDRSIFVDVGR